MAKRLTTTEKLEADFIKIFASIEEGEKNVLDGILEARELKTKVEAILKTAASKESDLINEIQEEASKYKNVYKGYSFSVGGRKTLVYKGIPEIDSAEESLKNLKEKYKNAFEGTQKGTVKIIFADTEKYKKVPHFEDADGFLRPFPEVEYAKTSLTLRKGK